MICIIRCYYARVPDLYASLNNITRLIVSTLEEYRYTPNKSRLWLKSILNAISEAGSAK